MKNIGVVFDKSGKGGGIYNQLIVDAIKNNFDIETYEIFRSQRNRAYNYIKLYYQLSKISGEKDVWIRTANSVVTLPFDRTLGKNIAIIHHIDNSFKSAPLKIFSVALEKIMLSNLKSIDMIVVVSQFWKEYFEKLGYRSIEVIYNPFNLKDFVFSNNEVEQFRERYGLSEKPIIYLGNCQKAKGVVEAYEALKGVDVQLVTSGIKDIDLPVLHLDLNYKDYLVLLHESSIVVTMSKFNEGWCRTAHEAMICNTPVVGSGMGGMGELLDGGKQIICPSFSRLKDCVESAINDPKLGESGYKFATRECFTFDYFKNKWVDLINYL